MSPETYDAWYGSARGSWIWTTEYDLLDGLLQLCSGESMLDVHTLPNTVQATLRPVLPAGHPSSGGLMRAVVFRTA